MRPGPKWPAVSPVEADEAAAIEDSRRALLPPPEWLNPAVVRPLFSSLLGVLLGRPRPRQLSSTSVPDRKIANEHICLHFFLWDDEDDFRRRVKSCPLAFVAYFLIAH